MRPLACRRRELTPHGVVSVSISAVLFVRLYGTAYSVHVRRCSSIVAKPQLISLSVTEPPTCVVLKSWNQVTIKWVTDFKYSNWLICLLTCKYDMTKMRDQCDSYFNYLLKIFIRLRVVSNDNTNYCQIFNFCSGVRVHGGASCRNFGWTKLMLCISEGML